MPRPSDGATNGLVHSPMHKTAETGLGLSARQLSNDIEEVVQAKLHITASSMRSTPFVVGMKRDTTLDISGQIERPQESIDGCRRSPISVLRAEGTSKTGSTRR